ncbi:MAG: GHKL domain-containing protein [Lachnospiraceae bacterium]|nr:GHKL domain-containing protein [Lachnospiraceae bacterium]
MGIICSVVIVIMAWIVYYVCCTMFLKLRWSGRLGKFYYISYVCTNLFVTQITDNSNVTFIFELLMPLIFFKGKIIKKEMVYWISTFLSSLLLLAVNEIICKIMEISSMEIVQYRITARMVFVLSLVICYYLISLVKIKIDNRLAVIGTQSLVHFLVLMIMLFAIVCFLIQIYQYELSEEILAGIENATCGIFMLVLIINMISFEIFKSSIFQARKYAEEKARLEMYEMQRAHYRLTTEQIKKLSALRHDFKNHLYVIAERIRRGENKEAIAYIDKIGASTEEAGSIIVAENEILATILTVKNVICKNKDIGFVCEIACEKIHIEDMDLNTVVANLLDNAIEASEKCEKDQRNISFKIKDVKQFIVIECCNTCKEKSAGKKHIFQTTKDNKEEHGYGMENIKETVEKYGGQTEFSCESGVFSAKIMMENTGH